MYEEPLTITNSSTGPAPPPLSHSGFAYTYKIHQDMGHIATRALRHARRILVASPFPEVMPATLPATPVEPPTSLLPSRSTLKKEIKRTNESLCSMKTVFPIKLFTHEVVLDRTKLTVTRRNFFFSSDTMSIRIEDILNVTVGVGPFFGVITVATRVLSSDDHFTLNRFWRKDAIHMKHMIQGFVIARHNNIRIDHLEHDELVKTLTEIGQDSHRDRYITS